MNTINFKLEGLTCEACVKLAANRIKKIPGVQEVEISYKSGDTQVTSVADIDLGRIKESIEGMTFKVAN